MKQMSDNLKTTTRIISYDLLRICAAVMVVLLHVAASKWDSQRPDTAEWFLMNMYDSFVRSAVPIFYMLSGAFLLKRDIPLKDLYVKKIIPLSIIWFVWSFMYAVEKIGMKWIVSLNFKDILTETANSKYHLWFIPTLVGLYILQPVLRGIVEYKEGGYVKYILTLFVIFGIIRPTVLLFLTESAIARYIRMIPVELMSNSCYMILGHYLANISRYKFKPLFMLLLFGFSGAICAIVCQLDALKKGAVNGILYDSNTITSFLGAVSLFLCFKHTNWKYSPKAQKRIVTLSSLSFGVYLIHPFVMKRLSSILNLTILSYHPLISIPVNTMIIVSISFLITAIMVRIPIMNRLWKL